MKTRAAAERAAIDVGEGPALLGEAVKTGISNLIVKLGEALDLWNRSGLPGVGDQGMTPAPPGMVR